MKNKLLSFLAALAASAGFSVGVQAQTTDVTDAYITNPSFEILNASGTAITAPIVSPTSIYGWSIPTGMSNLNLENGTASTGASAFGLTTASNGTIYFYNRKGWGSLTGALSQETKSALIPGTYYITFDYKSADYSNNNNLANNGSTLKMSITGGSQQIATTATNRVAYSHTNNGSSPSGTALTYFKETNWNKMGLLFVITVEGKVTITVTEALKNSGRSDMLFDNFRLYKVDQDAGSQNVDFTGLIANPNADQPAGWSREFTSTTNNFLSTENTSFTTATRCFLEVWGNSSTSGVIPSTGKLHQTISGLPNGIYELGAAYKVSNQANSTVDLSNIFLYANTKELAITGNGISSTGSVSAAVTDGTLDFGLVAKAANANWFCLDKLTLTYLGFDPAAMITALQVQIDEARNNLVGKYMQTSVATELDGAINQTTTAIGLATRSALEDASTRLGSAINAAATSIASYSDLNVKLAEANGYYSASGNDAAAFKTVIDAAQAVYNEATMSVITQSITDLDTAIFNYRVANASNTSSVDVTRWLPDADMTKGTSSVWKNVVGDKVYSVNSSSYIGFTGTFLEKWTAQGTTFNALADFDITQTVTNLPNGLYTLKAYCLATQQGKTGSEQKTYVQNVSLYANAASTSVATISGTPEQFTVANASVIDGTLKVGYKSVSGTANWIAFDNCTLTYLGFDPAAMIATLQTQKDEATLNLVGKYMQTSVATELDGAINQATTAIGLATKTALEDAGARLGSAINAATASIASYVALNAAIAAADASLYTNISGYSDYLAAISSTQNLYDACTIDDATIATAITTLKAAEFICLETAPNFTTSIQNSDITNGATGWTVAKGSGNGPTNSGEGNGLYLDSWASNWTTGFSATQTLSLPNGTYIASAYARAAVANVAALKLNDVKTYAKSSTWGTIFAKTTVTDGTLAIGVVSETFSGSYWFSFDDFKLYRVDVPYVVAVTDKAASVKGAIDDAAVTEIGSALANATSADFSKAKANSAKTIPNANPNLIAYNVPANVTVDNAITAGCTKELTENYPFYAPTALTMTVSYVRSFTAASGDNVSGWQSIVVPFNVTAITATKGGNTITLEPFSTWNGTTESTSSHPFWLYKAKADGTGYETASSIEANVPYLISIPNDPSSYADFYNVSGNVTFTGTALAVTSTTVGALPNYSIVPNFDGNKVSVYALNAAGSLWESGKSVNSFYAYATSGNSSAPKFISIFGDGEVTGIKDILSETTMTDKTVSAFAAEGGVTIVSKNPGKVAIYTDGGLLLKVVPVGEGSNFVALASGKYIVNATVVIVK